MTDMQSIEVPTEFQQRGLYCVMYWVGDYQGAISSNECWYFRNLSPMKEDPIETSIVSLLDKSKSLSGQKEIFKKKKHLGVQDLLEGSAIESRTFCRNGD
jgi:hypothetical protein